MGVNTARKYVIKRGDGEGWPYVVYNGAEGFGLTLDLESATLFTSVQDAVAAIVVRTKNFPEFASMAFTISRVREVTTTRYVEEAL